MSKIQRFEDLGVWQDAMKLSEEIYQIICDDKIRKEYSIRDQLIRALISITNNIAEGFEYDNTKDFIKFLRYSKGSTGEIRNILTFLLRIKLISPEIHKEFTEKAINLSKQLYGFINYLRNRNKD
ncbi:MAG TPA: four helix bundle protein [Ignavibacteria bacterium]|nr:four helix bundle protein [Ignavibacteria bacterium]